MPTNTSIQDRASQRVNELADEIQRRYEQGGKEVSFGLDTGIAAQQFMEASQLVDSVEGRIPNLLDLTFRMPVQDAVLIDKCGSYPFKGLIGYLVSAKTRIFLDRDGQSGEFNSLYLNSMHSSSDERREQARKQLLRLAGPYIKQAQASLIADLVNYDPFSENSIVGFKVQG